MAHDLMIPDEKKVLSHLDSVIEKLKAAKQTNETVAAIGTMNLAIAGCNPLIQSFGNLDPQFDSCIKVVTEIMEEIQNHVAAFNKANEDITL